MPETTILPSTEFVCERQESRLAFAVCLKAYMDANAVPGSKKYQDHPCRKCPQGASNRDLYAQS